MTDASSTPATPHDTSHGTGAPKQSAPRVTDSGAVISSTGKPHLSASQIDTFIRCSEQYRRKYVERQPDSYGIDMYLGLAIHDALALNYGQKVTSGNDLLLDVVTDKFSDAFSGMIARAMTKQQIPPVSDGIRDDLLNEGAGLLELYMREHAPTVQPLQVEYAFEVSLGDKFPFVLVGKVDVETVEGIIIDHKVVKKTPSQKDVDMNTQLTSYALQCRLLREEIEGGLRIDALVRTKTPKIVSVETSRTNTQVRWLIMLMERIAASIEAGAYVPNPTSYLCGEKWCAYWDSCMGMTDVAA